MLPALKMERLSLKQSLIVVGVSMQYYAALSAKGTEGFMRLIKRATGSMCLKHTYWIIIGAKVADIVK